MFLVQGNADVKKLDTLKISFKLEPRLCEMSILVFNGMNDNNPKNVFLR